MQKNLNKKGMTLLEMMVVVIIIAGMILVAYPTYLSSLEKGRALEAVRLVSNFVAAQVKYIADNNGAYATSFKALDVDPSGKDKTTNPTVVTDTTVTTQNFVYTLTGSTISASSRSNSYAYNIIGTYDNDTITCETSSESGKKICSSLGLKISDGKYRIE